MRRSPLTAALAVLAAVCLVAAVTLGALLVVRSGGAAGEVAAPSDTSLEAGFARDMQAHHRQAVTMSLLLLDRSQDTRMRSLASDIMLTQQQQAGQMHGWLEVWGLPQTGSQPVMAWMDHDAHAMQGMDDGGGASGVASMPGMASDTDLQRLRESTGTDAERLYLQLMVPHHEAGVEMADAALAQTDDPAVSALAGAVATSQTSELAVLRALLAERGGPLSS